VDKQNVTLSLPRSLLKKAKTLAITKDKSLSEFLRETLEERVNKETGYQKARNRQIAFMGKGIDLGTQGKITIARDDLHERR